MVMDFHHKLTKQNIELKMIFSTIVETKMHLII